MEVAPSTTSLINVTTTAAPTTTVALSGPAHGGEVIVADDQEPPTLNPFVEGGDYFIVNIIGQAHQVGVWDIDGTTLERIPDVVTELPTVANGGVVVNGDGTMTVNYRIVDEAVWADGVHISGTDFQFTYDTIMDPAVGADTKTYEDITSTNTGDKTFSVTLAKPTIAHEALFPVLIPEHEVSGTNFVEDWNERPWVSGGPFVFDSWSRGDEIVLVRNDNYWKVDPETGLQLPFLDKVTFRFIPETEAIVAAFRAREVDVIQPSPAVETIDRLRALEPDGAAITVLPGPAWEHLNFQFGPGRLERNPGSMNEYLTYRQAVAHAIDREAIARDITDGFLGSLDSYVSAFTPTLSTDAWRQYEYDPARARELLEELCVDLSRDCADDPIVTIFSATGNADERPRVAQMMADMFEAVGIAYEVQLEDSQLFFGETLETGRWDFGEWAWVGSPGLAGLVSIHDVFDPEAPPTDDLGSYNYYRWGTPDSSVIDDATARFARIVDEMNATVDEAELTALVQEAEKILADQVVIIPLWSRPTVGAVWADEIGGYEFNTSQAGHTWNIEWWYRTDA